MHKNPKIKKQNEVHSTSTMQYGGNIGCDSEVVFSEFTTYTELRLIFGSSTSNNLNTLAQIMLLEGAPGIGKTAVIQEIANQWAEDKMLPHIKLLLLIYLRQIDMHRITSFTELMQRCYPDNKTIASSCAEYFTNTRGENLMIIFDGYDEMNKADQEITKADQEMSDSFLMKLLQRKALPECCLVVTSRPYITAHLHKYCNCRIEIMGLTKKDRYSYFKENLSSEKLNTVTYFLKKHLIIDSLCYIPLNLVSFLSLVEYDIPLPKTQTELTSHTVHLTVARNIDGKGECFDAKRISMFEDREISNIIMYIASFAYTMLDKEQLVFSESDMKSIGFHTEGKHENCGLLKAVQIYDVENLQCKKVYSFVHFSVQEYLAAYHLSKKFSISQAFALHHKFWDVKYFGVWRMYTGLTKGNNFALQIFLSQERLIIGVLRFLFGFEFPGLADELKRNKVVCLQLFQIFLEAPDSKIKESVSDVVKNNSINLSAENLSRTDINMLSYFVARSYITKEWQLINLCQCNIDDDKLKQFYQVFCIRDGREIPLIKFFDISQNNICELETLINLITKCKVIIHLKASIILTESKTLCRYLCNAPNIDDFCNRTLRVLDLTENKLNSQDVCTLCNALAKCKNLEEINLSNNDIDDYATGSLIEAIVQWDNLKKFKYEQNNFSDHAKSLLEFTINHLKFNRKSLDFKGEVKKIHHFIAVLGYAKNVAIKDSRYINCISHLCELNMDCIDSEQPPLTALTTDASIFFQKNFKPLEKLNLSGLTIDEGSVNAITFSSNLQYLKINKCKLTSKTTVIIAHQIKIAGGIKELQFCNNCIDDEATKELIVAFFHCKSLKTFKYEGNQFTRKSKMLFNFLLCHINYSDSTMNLSGNRDDILSFITLLTYVKEVPVNKSVYVENISKITDLNLNCLSIQAELELTVISLEGFSIFRHLVSLNISGIIINENAANCLVKAFDSNLNLEQLFLNKCRITNTIIKLLCQKLKFNSFIKAFEVKANFIDDEAVEELAMTILHWDSLQYINLARNKISTQCMLLLEMLTEDLEPQSIISNNYFRDNHCVVKSFIEVSDYASNHAATGERTTQFLNNFMQITELSLQVQTPLEMTLRASDILKKANSMNSINLSGIIISEQVANNLCDFFDNNQKTLKQMIMNDCKLDSNKLLKFVHKLNSTIKMVEAHFCHNEIDDSATKSLVIAILHWNAFKTIELENNCFTKRSIQIFEFLKAFSDFSSRSIDLNGDTDRINSFLVLLGCMMDVDVTNSILVKNVYKLKKLLLDSSNEGIGKVQFEVSASKFLSRLTDLTELNISGIAISNEVAENLANTFNCNSHSLECLIMNKCQLTSTIILKAIENLQSCSNLRNLELCCNDIDDTATKTIAIGMFYWNFFEVFEFQGNKFSRPTTLVFKFLLPHLKFSGLSINLSDNLDDLSSFIILLGYMKEVNPDRSVYVENISKITDLNLNCLAMQAPLELTVTSSEGLSIFSHLVSLNISGIIINENAANCLVKVFDGILNLEQLFLNKCHITNTIIKLLCQQLRFNSLIKAFEVEANFIDDEAVEELAMTILHWNSLQYINLARNKISTQCMLLLEMLTEDLKPQSIISNNYFIDNHCVVKSFIEVSDCASNHTATGERTTQFLNNFMQITELSLQVQTPLEMTLRASDILKKANSMNSINLSGIIISEQVANNLCDFFDNNQKSLKQMIMNDCKLDSSKLLKFVHKLKLTIEMVEVQFCQNDIDDRATKPLVTAILHWNAFQTLELENNCFTKRSIQIFEFLKDFSNFSSRSINLNDDIDKINSFLVLLECMMDVDAKNSVLVKNVCKVKKLLLDSSKESIGKVQFEVSALMFLSRLIDLTELNISGIAIGNKVAENLANVFHCNSHSLECLIMNKCQLTSTIILKAIESLQSCLNLRNLELCSNDIDDTATKAIAIGMFYWNFFEVFEFQGNKFSRQTTSVFKFLLPHLKFSGLSINLSDNLDDLSSFIILLGYMEEVNPDRSVYVENISKITDLNLNCLAMQAPLELTVTSSEGLSIFSHLVSLNISGIIINENAANCLVKAFDSNLNLEQLFLNKCHITNRIIKLLCQQLKVNILCKAFEVAENLIDDEAVEELAMTILHWNSLQYINLARNKISTQCMLLLEMLTEDLEPQSIISNNYFIDNHCVVKSFIEVSDYASNHTATGERITQFLNNFMQITELSLQVQTPLEMTLHASDILKKANSMNSINLSGIIISEQVANNLCDFFDNNQKTLKYLFMNNCKLDSNKLLKFVHKLKSATEMVEVQFCQNDIDDRATKPLVTAILHWNAFKKLELENNYFTKRSIQIFEFLKAFSNFSSRSINLNGNIDKINSFLVLLECMMDVGVKNSVLVKNVHKVKKLLLDSSNEGIGKVQFEVSASKFLSRLTDLTELNISGIAISNEVADNLANTFNCNSHSLECLIMNKCQLTSTIILKAIESLQSCSKLRNLELCSNDIDDTATKTIAIGMFYWNFFKVFEFQRNKFSRQTTSIFKFLLPHLKFSGLSINLSDNLDDLSSFIILLGYMKEVNPDRSVYVKNISKITYLNLNCLAMQTPLELIVTSSEGLSIFSHLVLLNISGIIINENAANCLVTAFDSNLNLEQLFLNKCQITSVIIKLLCQQLRFNSLIKTFEVAENLIDDEAVEELAMTILHWNSLQYINLARNKISTQCMLLLEMLTEDLKPQSIISNNYFIDNHCVVKSFIEVSDYASNHTATGERTTQFLNNFIQITELSLQVQTPLEMTLHASDILKKANSMNSINLSGIIISEQVANNLCDFFDNNQKTLKHLVMNNCKLDSNKLLKFVHKLKSTTEMVEAQFRHNKIDDSATDPLVIAILHWNAFQVLELENNCFTEKSIRIYEVLKVLSKLSIVSINFSGKINKIIPFITILRYVIEFDIKDTVLVENISKVNKLLLDCSKQINNVQFEVRASQFFTRFFNLTKLNVSGIPISKEVADNLASAFDGNLHSLEHLVMNNCQLTSPIVTNLIRKLPKCVRIRELQLSKNFLNDEITETLIISILCLNELQLLKLEQNCFGKICDKVFHFLKKYFKFSDSVINFNDDMNSIIAFITLMEYMQSIPVNASSFVDNVAKIESLSLDCSKLNVAAEELELTVKGSQFFRRFQLIKLNLSGIIIKQTVINNILQAFGTDLQSLCMNNCKLNSETVIILMQKLNFARNIKKVELCNNNIGDKATGAIAIGILHWDFAEVNLEGIKLSEQCNLLLTLCMKDSQLESISFGKKHYAINSCINVLNFVNIDSSEKSLLFIKNILNATTLDLSVEYYQQEPELFLSYQASYFLQRFKNLKMMNISGIVIKQEAANLLTKAFSSNLYSLEHLIMNNCCLTSKMFGNFVIQLKDSASIEDLQWCDNKIDDEAIEQIVTAILSWNSLKNIKYHNNKFSTNCILLLKLLIERNTSATEIDFSNDYYSIKSIISVLSCIGNCSTNNTLCLKDNISEAKKLSLDCSQVKEKVHLSCESVNMLRDFISLTELNVSAITINEGIIGAFLSLFRNDLQELQCLCMNNCQISSITATKFVQALQKRTIKKLQLCDNLIDDEASETLALAILQWNSPQVKLEKNIFTKNCQMQLDLITNESSIFDSNITFDVDGDVKLFLTILHHMSNKNIYFKENASRVISLSLSTSAKGKLQLSKNASEAFKYFVELSKLEINGIIIDNEAAIIISQILASNHLEIFKLNYCQLDSKSAVKLLSTDGETVPVYFETLEAIDISCNCVEDDALQPLFNSFLQISKLETLQLHANKFTINVVPIISILFDCKNCKHEINYSNRHGSRVCISAFFDFLSLIKEDIAVVGSHYVQNIIGINLLILEYYHDDPLILNEDGARFFQRFTSLTELNLSGIHIHPKATEYLSYTLQKCTCLLTLKLKHCQLNSDSVNVLFSLANCDTNFLIKLKYLELSNNNIDDEATDVLIKLLIQIPVDATLCITGNSFSSNNRKALYSALSEFTCCNSTINYNECDTIEIFFILLSGINNYKLSKNSSNQIKNITDTEKLNLHGGIGTVELNEKASLFFQRFHRLTELQLTGICFSMNAVNNLADALHRNLSHTLELLKLRQCKLNSKFIMGLFHKVRNEIMFHKLLVFDISNNDIDDDAACVLITLWLQMPKLEELNIDGNYFNEEIFVAIEFMFAFNRNYTTVIDSTNPTICRYRSDSNNYTQKNRRSYYGKILYHHYSFLNLFYIYKETTTTYKESAYVAAFTKLSDCAKNISNKNSNQVGNIFKVERVLNFKQSTRLSKDKLIFPMLFFNIKELNLSGISIYLKACSVNKFNSLQNLALSNCYLSSKDVKTILLSLNKSALTNLCLAQNQITFEAADALKGFVDNNNVLMDMDLSYNHFKDEGAATVIQSLHTCSQLKRLDFSHNEITDEFTQELVTSLLKIHSYNKELIQIGIDGNNFKKPFDVKNIFDLITKYRKSQKVVEYDNSTLDNVNPFITLLGCLQNNSTEGFSQSNNIAAANSLCLKNVHHNTFCELTKEASLFFKKFNNLKVLKLSGILITPPSITILAKAIASNLALMQILELSDSNLNSDSAISVVSALNKREVQFLCLSHNQIDFKAASTIQSFIGNNNTLRTFDLANNCIGTEGIRIISQSFASCKSLQSLNVSYNNITDEGTAYMISSIVQMPWLTELVNNGNHNHVTEIFNFITELKIANHSIEYHNGDATTFLELLDCVKNVPLENSLMLKNISEIRNLYLISSHTCLPVQETSFIFFNHLTKLETLYIDGITIPLEAADVIAVVLSESFNSLQDLKLCNCKLSSNFIARLFPSNKECVPVAYKVLRNIDLSNNNICDEAIVPLVSSLVQMHELERLNLDKNQFQEHDINIIFDMIVNYRKFQKVIEYENGRLDYVNPFITLLGCLQNNSKEDFRQSNNIAAANSLCLKNVQHNTLCELTIEATLFFKKFKNLKALKLSGMLITPPSIKILAKAIASNLALMQILKLNDCNLNSDSAIIVVSALNKRQIRFLCLSHNQIDFKAASTIQSFTGNNNTLHTFDLASNCIGTEGIRIISQSFASCKSLQSLNVSYNNITDEGTVFMISSIVQMPWLTELVNNGNHNHITEIFNFITELKLATHSIEYHNGDATTFLELLDCVKNVPLENLLQLKNISKIRNLYLISSHTCLTVKETSFIFFNHLTKLETLYIDGITIPLEAADIIANVLSESFNSLQDLKLCNCELDSNFIVRLFPSNKECVPVAYKRLKNSDLSNNNICDKAIVSLVASLLQMCELEKLNLDNNRFVEHDVKSLFQLVSEFKVTKWYFKNTDGPWSVASFLTLLSSANTISLGVSKQVDNLTKLSQLELEDTGISKQCLLTFESAKFFEKFRSLISLTIQGIKIQPEAVNVIAKALDANLCLLEVLKVRSCAINSESATKIISSLNKVKIKILCLSWNAIDYKAAKILCDFVSNNNILREINMSHNDLATTGTITLIEGLVSCESLVKLDLSHNSIADDATESLVKLIKQFSNQCPSINISNNKLSQQSVKAIKAAMSWTMWFKCEI